MSINNIDGGELFFPTGIEPVDLPSKGKFYSIDHPLCGQESVEIYHMRGQEEDILTNIDFMKKGITIDKLLQNLFVNSNLRKPEFYNQILAADRNAILIAARITAYTWEYPVSLKCPACNAEQDFEFDLRIQRVYSGLEQALDDNIFWDTTKNLFKLVFPGTSVDILVRPRTADIENKITKKLLNKKKKDITNRDLYEDLIVEIKGNSDPNLIGKFFEQIPARHLNWLKAALVICNPEVSLLQQMTCKECNHEQTIEPPFTTDFLFPKVKAKRNFISSQENLE